MSKLDSYYDKRIVTIRHSDKVQIFVDGKIHTELKPEITDDELKQSVDDIYADIIK